MAQQQAFEQLHAQLQTALDGFLQDHALTEEQRQQVLGAVECIAAQLQQATRVAAAPVRTQVTPPYALQSPVYRPLSPAPVDGEIQELEQQVEEAAQRAASMRQAVPAKLKEIYAQKLAQLGPSGAAAGSAGGSSAGSESGGEAAAAAAAQENAGEGRDAQLAYSPDPQQLREKLADAGSRLPVLRARLEEASDRVQRVFAVLSSELNRPPPNTVERAVLGKTPGRPGAAAAGAGGSGGGGDGAGAEQAMRRRLGAEVQPVPLAMPGEEEEEEEGA